MAETWLKHGEYMAKTWGIYGENMGNIWRKHGKNMAADRHIWPIYGCHVFSEFRTWTWGWLAM